MDNIKCRLCKKTKQISEYDSFRGKLNKSCRDCRIKNNQWYAQDLDGRKTKAKERYQQIKNKIAKYRSDLRLDRKYSLTREQWDIMLKQQNNQCLICQRDFSDIKPCVDHNHKTEKVRALLCRRCNLDLQVVENTEFVKKAKSYLELMM